MLANRLRKLPGKLVPPGSLRSRFAKLGLQTTMWYRIFGANDIEPDHGPLLDFLNRIAAVSGRFSGDDAGWFHADILNHDVTLLLDRYTADETGIRAELNTWAAVVEAGNGGARLMERLIQTQQLFTLQGSETGNGPLLCTALCDYLARATDGFYQIDGQGIFALDGKQLWRET